MVTNKQVLDFLRDKSPDAGFIDRLKIRYRPLVCPFPELLALVKPDTRIGDVGCGSGQFALMIAAFCNPRSIYGIEISDRLVDNARKLFSGSDVAVTFEFEKFDGNTFPIALSTCDQLFMVDVLHHVPRLKQEQFIQGLFSIMKPGAQLILKDINGGSPLVVFNKIHDLVFSREIGCELSMNSAEAMVQKSGFTILSKFTKRTLVYPHYFLVLEKAV
jgi:SAM-dependent methyltransferase